MKHQPFARPILFAVCLTVASGMAMLLARLQVGAAAAQAVPIAVAIDADDIGGVVSGQAGPEAGVWVIAETTDLPTKFRKIVVTDDRGRFVIPDLPTATYKLWVRGYGLVDSASITTKPGQTVSLTAVPAPTPQAAAQYYPADYWYSLIKIPPKSEFPLRLPTTPIGEGAGEPQSRGGLGIGLSQPPGLRNQAEWIAQLKTSCELCHQMGTKATREIPPEFASLGSSIEQWHRRLQAGQQGQGQLNTLTRAFGLDRAIAMYADWTDRIKGGELPPAPPRPQGIERNVVVTLWEASGPYAFIHDVITTDRRNPTINGKGPIYAGEFNYDSLVMLDPERSATSMIPIETLVDKRALRPFSPQTMQVPSPFWGDQVVWEEHVQANNVAMDRDGRVWIVAKFREDEDVPTFCGADSNNKYAKNWPLKGTRGLTIYDPKTKKFKHLDTCFYTHHITFAEDANDTLFSTGNGTTIGWVDTKKFLATGNAEASQGWCPAFFDTNGDGKITQAIDKQMSGGGGNFGSYGIVVNPLDQSVWFASPGTPGKIVRMVRGANPPETCLFEAYEPPFNNPKAPGLIGFFPRGIDIDRNGIIWTALAGSGHIASFDRKKCKPTTGANANDGQRCVEGWTLYAGRAPKMKGVTDDVSADFYYYNWVDQYDTFGMGKNVPIATGTGSDALIAVDPATHAVLTIRVPYPMEFFARSVDGRIDDPNTGWKGRGLWAPNASRPTWHSETGKGTPSVIAHFQMRPDPLSK